MIGKVSLYIYMQLHMLHDWRSKLIQAQCHSHTRAHTLCMHSMSRYVIYIISLTLPCNSCIQSLLCQSCTSSTPYCPTVSTLKRSMIKHFTHIISHLALVTVVHTEAGEILSHSPRMLRKAM